VVTTGARRPEDRRESFAHRSASAAQRPGRACFVLPMRPLGDDRNCRQREQSNTKPSPVVVHKERRDTQMRQRLLTQ